MLRKHWEKWLLGLLMVLTIGLRIYHLPEYPYHEDGAGTVTILKSIVETGLPLTDSGYIYWRSLLGNYLMAVPLFFMEISPYSTRLVCVIFSGLLLPLVYFMGRSAQSRWAGWLAALFLAFSAYENLYASFTRFYLPFQFFFVAAVYFAGNYFILRRPRAGTWLLLATISSISTHKFAVELFLVFVLAFLLGRSWEILRRRDFYLGCLLTGAMLYVNFIYAPEGSYVAYTAIPLHLGGLDDKVAFYRAFREFVPYGVTLILLALVPLWQTRNRTLIFYFLTFMVSMVFLTLVAPHGNPRYMSNLFPLGIVLATASLTWWLEKVVYWVRRRFPLRLTPKVAVAGFLVLLAAGYLATLENREIKKAFGHYFKFPDQKPAHDFMAQRLQPSDLIISADPIFAQIYLGKPADFYIREKFDESLGRFRPFTDFEKSMGTIPLIDSPAAMEALLRERKERIWVYGNYKVSFTVSPRMKFLLNKYFSPVYRDKTSFLLVRH